MFREVHLGFEVIPIKSWVIEPRYLFRLVCARVRLQHVARPASAPWLRRGVARSAPTAGLDDRPADACRPRRLLPFPASPALTARPARGASRALLGALRGAGRAPA